VNNGEEWVLITDPVEEATLRGSIGDSTMPRKFTDGWNIYVDAKELAAWRIARKKELLGEFKKKPGRKPPRLRSFATKIVNK
jgi:hypothetical protein